MFFRLSTVILLAFRFLATDLLQQAQSLAESGKFSEAEAAVRRYLGNNQNSADAHYLLGYILFKENEPKASLAEYAAASKLRPTTSLDLEIVGGDYFLLEDYALADKWLTKSVELDPKNALALYFLGRTKYNEKHFEEAVHFFADCLKLDPQNVKAEENLGLSYEKLGRTEDAIAAYRRAIALDQTEPGPYFDLGTRLVENNRSSEAISYLAQATQLGPQDAQAHRELGKAYLQSNQLEQAQNELEKTLQIDPQNAPAHFLLADVYRKRGLPEKARAEANQYALLTGGHSAPDDPLSEARALVNVSKFAEAEQVMRRYLELHKNSADAHYLLGYILFKEQKAKDSLAEYTEGAKYRIPGAYDLEAVAADYVLLKDYGDADKWFTKSLEWNPNNLQALYYLARTKYNENRFDEAVNVFQQYLKRDPKSVKAEDNLGLSYEGLGQVDDAIAAYRTAISWQLDAKVKDPGPYIDLGNLLVENDRAGEAVPYLIQALQISPNDLRAHKGLGKAYLYLNQLEKAQAELEKSIELAPENAPTHFMLAQVYRKRGLNDKARAELQRFTQLSGAHLSPESSQ